jgi:Holliday junction resolvasome RuvABC ATP-dependent DNA helicase subunit
MVYLIMEGYIKRTPQGCVATADATQAQIKLPAGSGRIAVTQLAI